jgi:hypothetical protein
MKQALLIFLAVLMFGMFAGNSTAQQSPGKGVVIRAGEQYNPLVVYDGAYKPDILFVRTQGGEFWRRMALVYRLRNVACVDAKAQLMKAGKWNGHLDLKSGACASPDEPSEWALGNRINFDEQVRQLEVQ